MTGLHRRRKRTTTTEQYARMLQRMIAAYGPRIGEEPMVALSHLQEIENALADATNLGVHLAIESGQSPTKLADARGTTRQTIYKRAELGAEVAKKRRQQRPELRPGARTVGVDDVGREQVIAVELGRGDRTVPELP